MFIESDNRTILDLKNNNKKKGNPPDLPMCL